MKTSKENYFERIRTIGIKNLPDKMQKAHEYIQNVSQNGRDWKLYDRNEKIKQVLDKQFSLLDDELSKKGSPKVSEIKKSETKTSAPVKPKQKIAPNQVQVKKEVVKRSVTLPVHKSGKAVETLDPHLVFLSQYLSLAKKEVPLKRVLAFAKRLIRQVNARILRKASKYSGLIEKMKENIMDVVRTTKGAFALVTIPAGERKAIEKVVQEEHKMRSVQLLSQYAGQAEKITSMEKVRSIYNGMFNAIEKGEIPEDDRYFNQVIKTMKILKKYEEQKNRKAMLPLLPAELSGILGCGCQQESDELDGIDESENDGEETENFEEPEKPKSHSPISSVEFMKQKFPRYQIDEPWVKIFGNIEPGKHTVVFSKEKLGKTTTLVDFAGYLSTHHGPVLFIQKEEELSGTFQDKFEQTQAANPNLDVVDEMQTDDVLKDYKFVFLDSVSRLGLSPKQLVDLQKRLGPGTTLFAILHATKDGQHRGANDYVHDAAHIVEFPEFGAAFGKGRFKGHTGELVRFAEARE
jgi:hypothetical protein